MSKEPHQSRISDEEPGSIAHFSDAQKITEAQTRELISTWGNDHSVLVAEAEKLSRRETTEVER